MRRRIELTEHTQKSKSWILQHILPSNVRTSAFSRYLITLSKNANALDERCPGTRLCRRQLHILYLLNDIIHHVEHHAHDPDVRKHVQESLLPALPELFANAAREQKKRTRQRLSDLISVWQNGTLCQSGLLTALEQAVQNGSVGVEQKRMPSESMPSTKELPWIMPSTHGDSTAPFFDLPAANLMPHIIPNSTRPMRPDQVKPLQFVSGPADESLVNAMKDFLKEVKTIDDPYVAFEDEGVVPDIDEMGQLSYKNEADDVVGDTYYGWSRAFCEKMKNRGKDSHEFERGRSRSSSYSRSPSRSPRKRRRYSSSHSRSVSRSRSGSRSLPRFRDNIPRMDSSLSKLHNDAGENQPRIGKAQQYQQAPPASMNLQYNNAPPSMQSLPPLPIGNNGMPIPPPRPPNWQGPWPPPPPPPMSHMPNMKFPPRPGNWPGQQGYGRR